ncbi:MAG TPA: NADH:flavin oxidoreductase, partial [Stellaceae bacterium]|nr:NADH:flavin oxidoreductase [Stellaceae bacterium]
DPDWVRKLAAGRAPEIVHCIYCNVCKQLDENFKLVSCYLWPKGMTQAPAWEEAGSAPQWGEGGPALAAVFEGGQIRLTWRAGLGDVQGYDIYRAEEGGETRIIEAVKGTKYADRQVLGGLRYLYHIRAFDRSGRVSPPSNLATLSLPLPHYA